LHERLAQLLTLHALKRLRANARAAEARAALDSRIHAFEQLAQRSPTDYRIDKYASVSRERIRDSIGLLNEGGIVGLNAWDRVVTWWMRTFAQGHGADTVSDASGSKQRGQPLRKQRGSNGVSP